MNKEQRKKLDEMIQKVEDIASELETMADEEQDKLDNMPDGLRDGERGQAIEEAEGNLRDAYESLSSWVDEARGNLGV